MTVAVHVQKTKNNCLKITGKCGNFVLIVRLFCFSMQQRLIKISIKYKKHGSESKTYMLLTLKEREFVSRHLRNSEDENP